jgi:hypothetical protein
VWTTKLQLELTDEVDPAGRPVWELASPLGWGDDFMPPGLRSNLASVPRLPLVFLLAGDRAHKEALWHDGEYILRRKKREEADALFLEMLLANARIPPGLAHTMHKAVRWFGESSWRDETSIVQHPHITRLIRPA